MCVCVLWYYWVYVVFNGLTKKRVWDGTKRRERERLKIEGEKGEKKNSDGIQSLHYYSYFNFIFFPCCFLERNLLLCHAMLSCYCEIYMWGMSW